MSEVEPFKRSESLENLRPKIDHSKLFKIFKKTDKTDCKEI